MKNTKNTRLVNLKKGKVKKIGLVEGIMLRIRGYQDGMRGLPREDENGQWTSPHLVKEVNAYEEFAYELFGKLKLEEKEDFIRLGKLMDAIYHIRTAQRALRMEITGEADALSKESMTRKKGEEMLTDVQLTARREREAANKMAPMRDKLKGLQSQTEKLEAEFFALYHRILEDDRTTKLVCERVKEHIGLRMDVYWDWALRRHPKAKEMPIVPKMPVTARAQEEYKAAQEPLLKRAQMLHKLLTADEEMQQKAE